MISTVPYGSYSHPGPTGQLRELEQAVPAACVHLPTFLAASRASAVVLAISASQASNGFRPRSVCQRFGDQRPRCRRSSAPAPAAACDATPPTGCGRWRRSCASPATTAGMSTGCVGRQSMRSLRDSAVMACPYLGRERLQPWAPIVANRSGWATGHRRPRRTRRDPVGARSFTTVPLQRNSRSASSSSDIGMSTQRPSRRISSVRTSARWRASRRRSASRSVRPGPGRCTSDRAIVDASRSMPS